MSDSENESSENQLKVVLLGESCVGKTSLATRYCNNEFTRQYFPTSGVDFFLKRIILQRVKNVTLKIWDVGGTSQNGNMLDKYVFGANIILLIYDVTNEVTFHCLLDWIETVKNITKCQDKPPMMVMVGNKCDVEHQRAVKFEKHQKFANENNFVSSHIVSARTGESVNLSFQKVAADYLGLRLTRSQMEEFQPVVRAEISTYSNIQAQPSRILVNPSRSSVCCIQ